MSEFVERLKTLINQVPAKLENDSPHVNEALDVCLTLANIQEEMLTVIKNIANISGQKYDEELKEKSQYISTIERVVEKYPDEFSKIVFNTNKMKKLETTLAESDGLDEAIASFHELEALRKKWLDQAVAMDDWHKSLRMFMTGFSASAKQEERDKFIEDATRKIRETYSREDISSYLTWAIRESAQALVNKKK